MLKPFASSLFTCLFMLILIITLRGTVHVISNIDSAASGVPMVYYRYASRLPWPESHVDREQRPDSPLGDAAENR